MNRLAVAIRDYDARLNDAEQCPTGDDYNNLVGLILLSDLRQTYDVLFTRTIRDEVFEGRTTTAAERFDQLVRELHQGDSLLALTFRATVTHDGNAETILARVQHDGDTLSLRDRLQRAYDNGGAAGFFQIGAEA